MMTLRLRFSSATRCSSCVSQADWSWQISSIVCIKAFGAIFPWNPPQAGMT
jgi:hypothetical protein